MNRRLGMAVVALFAGLSAGCGMFAASQSRGSSLSRTPNPPAATSLLLRSTAAYSVRLREVCAGAVLFEHTHGIGTRAGAIAVANDIRTSGAKRLSLADDVPKPPRARELAKRWITVERRLTEMYATNYLRIWSSIERARAPQQRALLPAVLRALIDEPRPLERRAAALEATLDIPDCTGGSGPATAGAPRSSTAPPA